MKIRQSPTTLQLVSGGSHRGQIGTSHPISIHMEVRRCAVSSGKAALPSSGTLRSAHSLPPSPSSPHSTLSLLAWLVFREHLLLAEGLYLGICLDHDVSKKWRSLAGFALPAPHLRSLLFQTVSQALFLILNSVQTDVGLPL